MFGRKLALALAFAAAIATGIPAEAGFFRDLVDNTGLNLGPLGGETTGTVLRTESGTFELQFPADGPLAGAFVEGRKALVVGPMVEKQGVEIARRTILEVKDALVCPASSAVINCQPPNESKVCEFGNRLWIERSCGGVSFVD